MKASKRKARNPKRKATLPISKPRRQKKPKLLPPYDPHSSHVPARTRARMERWRQAFIDALARIPSVAAAARAAGISRTQAYALRDRDEAFAAAWDDALNQSIDVLEGNAYVRAIRGDSQLTMFFLKAHRPEKYRDNARLDIGLLGGIVQIPCKSEGAE